MTDKELDDLEAWLLRQSAGAGSPRCETMVDAQQAIAELRKKNAGLVGALEAVLAHEDDRAKLQGYAGCACINYSRNMERAYETGTCPHQIARAALKENAQ